MIAMLAHQFCNDTHIFEAAHIANVAGSLQVQKRGVTPITIHELETELLNVWEVAQ